MKIGDRVVSSKYPGKVFEYFCVSHMPGYVKVKDPVTKQFIHTEESCMSLAVRPSQAEDELPTLVRDYVETMRGFGRVREREVVDWFDEHYPKPKPKSQEELYAIDLESIAADLEGKCPSPFPTLQIKIRRLRDTAKYLRERGVGP